MARERILVAMSGGVDSSVAAARLHDQGHEVGLFCIIDTFVLQHSEIRWLAHIEAFRARRRYVSQLPILTQVSHYKQAIRSRLRRLLLHETEPLSPWAKAVQSGREFQPKRFRAPVVLFKRPTQPYFKIKDREMGWGRRSFSEVKICTVDVAAHDEMLREPAVRVMAEQLKDTMSHIEKGVSFRDSVLEGRSVTM